MVKKLNTRLLSSIVTVGQRGTIVIPAEIRKDMGMACGDTMMISWDGDGLRLQPVPSDPVDRLEWAINQAYEGMSAEEVETSVKARHAEWDR